MSKAPAKILPSWTWGSSASITIKSTGLASQQLADVQLPEPAVCSIYFQASIRAKYPVDLVRVFTLNLLQGVGRVTVPRQVSFLGQPATGAPLEWTMPFVPLHALQVNFEVIPDFFSILPDPEIVVDVYLVLSPISRIEQPGADGQKIDFGMAEPGEADEMDDELRENLEAESPSVQSIMEQERLDGDGETAPPIDVEGEEVSEAPTWMLDLVDALTERLGRPPTRQQLAVVLHRMRQRQQRRARRG